jgi:hypothetical protein
MISRQTFRAGAGADGATRGPWRIVRRPADEPREQLNDYNRLAMASAGIGALIGHVAEGEINAKPRAGPELSSQEH